MSWIHLMLAAAIMAAPSIACAQTTHHHKTSPYAGEEARDIKALSAEDIEELRRGGGWGLAKAAELNGMPGPAHLLELRDAIPLTRAQTIEIQSLFSAMRAAAVEEGERLIAEERRLDEAFRAGLSDESRLRELLAGIEASRTSLRHIHLATHIAASKLLTKAQIERYNELRGYRGVPNAGMAAGHDRHQPSPHKHPK